MFMQEGTEGRGVESGLVGKRKEWYDFFPSIFNFEIKIPALSRA
jgi:hypothetical protein